MGDKELAEQDNSVAAIAKRRPNWDKQAWMNFAQLALNDLDELEAEACAAEGYVKTLERCNAKLERVREAARKLRNEAKGAIGMPGFCYVVGFTNMSILQLRIDEIDKALAACEDKDD